MRLFVSIELPAKIRDGLHKQMPDLEGWRKTVADKLHITLLFIGSCTGEEMEEIAHKLNQVPFNPFEMDITRYGVFYHNREPTILWRQAKDDGSLSRLREHVVRAAGPFVKGQIRKSFHPHITLARRKKHEKPDLTAMEELLSNTTEPLRFISGSFCLMQSRLSPEGSQYEILREYSGNQLHRS